MTSTKSQILQEVLRAQGLTTERSPLPHTIGFVRSGVRYAIDVDDSDPGFFALRAWFDVPAGLASPETQLALGQELGVRFKGIKVFSSPTGREVIFNVESFVPGPTEHGLAVVLRRALRAIDHAVADFHIELLLGLATSHHDGDGRSGGFAA